MREKLKRTVSVILVLVMVLGASPLGFGESLLGITASAEMTVLQESMQRFFLTVKGVNKGNYDFYVNGDWHAAQCHGFACDLWFHVFGCDMYQGKSYQTSDQTATSAASIESFMKKVARPGDIIRKRPGGGKDWHSFVIKSINSTGLTVYTYGYPFGYAAGAQEITKTWDWFSSYFKGASYFLYKVNDSIYKAKGGINNVNYVPGCYKTIASGVRFRTQPSTASNTSIIRELAAGTNFEVTQVVSGTGGYWGKTVINGKTGYVALWYSQYIGPSVTKPVAPSVTVSISGDCAVGNSVTVNWSAASANGYNVYIYRDSTVILSKEKTTEKSLAFELEEAGSYSIKANAYNAAGTGVYCEKNNFVAAHDPSNVTFVYWDGTAETRTVKYGEAAVPPEVPEREGYIFSGWDKSFDKVTSDIVISATYKLKSFSVNFVDSKGNALGKAQTVNYGEAAVEPENKNVPSGYRFVGWSTNDYMCVKDNLKVQAIYSWANDTLPVMVQNASAVRNNDGYTVTFDIQNNPDTVTSGRAVVSIKTTEDKLVETTESAAFSITKGGLKSGMEVFVPCSTPATIAEIVIVDSYSSGVPISEVTALEIDQGLAWSSWSFDRPQSDYDQLETRTVYRYRDKEFSTSQSATKDGWTPTGESSFVWSDYGPWSSWSKTAATQSDSRKVETKTVTDTAAYEKWNIYYYRYWNSTYSDYYYTYGKNGTKYTKTVKSTDLKYYNTYDGHDAYQKKSGYYNFSKELWYVESKTTVPAVTHKEYRYADRSKIYTYNFFRWSDWSDWSDSEITAGETRDVETATQYRYRNNSSGAVIEDNTGVTRNISKNVGSAFAGKQAALFVYKVNEASDFTNEYVGQTTVSANGSCDFSFVLREEPSVKTGDMTVALGIEGTTNTMIIGTIEAPKPTYTVTFYDWNGTVIGEPQTVTEGENAALPANPEREGYTFIGWDNSTINIRRDVDLTAQYMVNKYFVTFVDWEKQTVNTVEYEYASTLALPDADENNQVENMIFDGWFIGENKAEDGSVTVTENLLLEAKYAKVTHDVIFKDLDGETIGQIEVPHDDVIETPDDVIEEEEKEINDELKEEYGDLSEYPQIIFMGWKAADGEDCLVADRDVELLPVYTFSQTAEVPVADITTGEYDSEQTVTLSCATENSVIFYTLDGTNPYDSSTAIEYTQPITLTESCVLQFYASAMGMNDSGLSRELYAVNTSSNPVKYHIVTVITDIKNETNDIYQELILEYDQCHFDESELTLVEGYTYDGLYFDEEFEIEFDPEMELIDATQTLYAHYIPNQYTATFYDYDGFVLGTSTVDFGKEAEAPTVPKRTGYKFIGWDSDAYLSMVADVSITAKYVSEDEYATIKFAPVSRSVYTGNCLKIQAKITPAKNKDLVVLWSVSDDSIAVLEDTETVGSTNYINIISAGTVTVKATLQSTGESAELTIHALLSTDKAITLGSNSALRYDTSGFIREVRAGNNTVGVVKQQFITQGLKFYNINGTELGDSDLVGTGTVVKLFDEENGELLDQKTFVVPGDFDGNGIVTAQDCSHTSSYLVDKETAELYQLLAIDVNGDGRVNTRDSAMILRYTVGKEVL